MALEPITRQEKIIAGKDLQPVTRMEFFLKAYGGGGSGGGAQPDWNQNDSAAADYVKNRPFYTGDPVETVLLEETTAEFTENKYLYSYKLSNPLSLEVGQTYQVSWDGAVYECVGTDVNGTVVLGNLSITNAGEDTGEPFIYGFANFFTKDTSASHTISISANVTPITKIDEKYLPEPYMNKVNPAGTGSFGLNRRANTEIGGHSFASGYNTTASGETSHAEGNYTTASGETSHAEGHYTTASGNVSHAEGSNTKASGYVSHAEGYASESSGEKSHAEGNYTTASGETSHAEGDHTTASGYYSHAEGYYTKASSNYQHVQGILNIEDSSNTYAHIVGNGTADNARSNAHTLDWLGNAWYAGTAECKALILPSSTEGSTKKFKITVDDSGTLKATEVT